jgi:translation elongation factor EF-1alpha
MDTMKWGQARYQKIVEKLEPKILELGFLISNIRFLPISSSDG